MNNLCADIGYLSVNHYGEELCGDHVDVVEQGEDSSVIVLADGLGSGVKASILSTLTAKIISTMMAAGLSLEDCVETISASLPICSVRQVAYSTFTILHLVDNKTAQLIQYDNPLAILLRDGVSVDYPKTEMSINGKRIYSSVIKLQENDIFVLMSDGCPHAGIGNAYNFGWSRQDIAEFLSTLCDVGYTAKTLSTILIDEVTRLYDNQPGDDATVCTVKVRRREPMNLLFGPPAARDEAAKMMSLFFSKQGKHIVCGGTTSKLAAEYLHRPLTPCLDFIDPEIPPTANIEGVDLVTEGVITINRVLQYAQNYLQDNEEYTDWSLKRDGASRIAQLLFEEATDINFYVGRAINPAHQNPDLPISFSIKMQLIGELSECLKKMGKRIKVSYF